MRRIDAAGRLRDGPSAARVLATGVTTPGHAVAAAGPFRWLTAYARYGSIYGDEGSTIWRNDEPASRVFLRFVYSPRELR